MEKSTQNISADLKKQKTNPWTWIPSLYFIEGIPYGMVVIVAQVMYKNFGLSNTELAFYTSWLYLPWVIKPFWAPFVEIIKTKRWWILSMQYIMAILFGLVAFTLPMSFYLQASLGLLWGIAFGSATHDVAADGFYMISLRQNQQSFFVGIRSLFYRFSMIATQGGIIWVAGYWEQSSGDVPLAWQYTFLLVAGLMALFALYHQWMIPRVETQKKEVRTGEQIGQEFLEAFRSFFAKKEIGWALAFLLLYRLAEAQLVKLAQPFLLDSFEVGGLGLSTQDVGLVYGTAGPLGLIFGGILGGVLIARQGLKHWIWWMLLAINLPNVVYIYLAFILPTNLYEVSAMIFVESFGYGLGFSAYMVYMLFLSQGKYQTAHFAICTGFMALGMMLPGMLAGKIQEILGYQHFFIYILITALPAAFVLSKLKLEGDFGKKG